MKKHILKYTIISSVFWLFSCKTIEIQERWAFIDSKYNYDKFSKYVIETDYPQKKKDTLMITLNNVIKSNQTEITTKDNVKLLRYFYKIDSLNVEYFVFSPDVTKNIGLFYIGNGSSIFSFSDYLIELSNKTHSKIYVLNYRGYGKTDGIPSFKTQFNDNQLFINKILEKEKGIDFIIGYSLGSVFATYSAIDNDIGSLYLLAPFSNSKETFKYLKKQKTKGFKSLFRPFIKLKADPYLMNISNTEKIENYQGKLVIFHGTDDSSLPYKMGKSIFDISTTKNKKIYTINGGDHNASFKHENWKNLINEINE